MKIAKHTQRGCMQWSRKERDCGTKINDGLKKGVVIEKGERVYIRMHFALSVEFG